MKSLRVPGLIAVAFLALAGALFAFEADRVTAALSSFPLWAALVAGGAQILWLICRSEAWRYSLNAVGVARVPRREAHAANGVAFLVGAIQSAGTVPARALALRALAPTRSPTLAVTLVADAPVLALETALIALLLIAATLEAPKVPTWGAALAFAAALAWLGGLYLVRERFRDRGLAAGLGVLTDRRRGPSLLALTSLMAFLSLARSWAVLDGFGLPHEFASSVIFLAAIGLLATLPIGPVSSPAAALAVFGASDPTKAASAGIAMGATALAAITVYGAISLLLVRLAGGTPVGALSDELRRQPA